MKSNLDVTAVNGGGDPASNGLRIEKLSPESLTLRLIGCIHVVTGFDGLSPQPRFRLCNDEMDLDNCKSN